MQSRSETGTAFRPLQKESSDLRAIAGLTANIYFPESITMKSRLGGMLLAAALIAAPSFAFAQNPFHINVAAGAAIPTGDLSDVASVGYNITAGIGFRPALSPLGFRVEGK